VRVAIAGATGHVGRVLAWQLGALPGTELVLAARAPDRVAEFARAHVAGPWEAVELDALGEADADVLVNALGVGDPRSLTADVLSLEAAFDDLFVHWLAEHPKRSGIAISSGAVFDTDFSAPADDSTPLRDPDGSPETPGDAYGIAKSRMEHRHRALPDLSIVDLRLFGLYSRFLDPDAGFLMNDVARALKAGTVFQVGAADLWRDYIAPSDLAVLVAGVMQSPPRNTAFDVVSKAPVRVAELLDAFAAEYGLAYTTTGDGAVSPTGLKPRYYSVSSRTQEISYLPRSTALDALRVEVRAVVENG